MRADYGTNSQSRASRGLSSDLMLQARNAKFIILEGDYSVGYWLSRVQQRLWREILM